MFQRRNAPAKKIHHGQCMSARAIKMSVCTSAHFSKIAAQCAMEAFRLAAARFLWRASEDPSSSCRPPKSSLCSSNVLCRWMFTISSSSNDGSLWEVLAHSASNVPIAVRSNGHVTEIGKEIHTTSHCVKLAPRFDCAIILKCGLVLHEGAFEVVRRRGKSETRHLHRTKVN